MTVKAVTGPDATDVYRAPAYGREGSAVHLVNLDPVNAVYYEDGPTVTPDSNRILPLGSANFDGSTDIWCSTLDPAITVLVQTGIRGQHGWNSGPVQSAIEIQSMGVPPQVPNINSVLALAVTPGQSPFTILQMPSKGRIWGINLAGSVISNTPPATARVYFLAQIDGNGIAGQGTPLAALELGAVNTNEVDSDSIYIPFNGLVATKNQNIYLIVNGGNTVTNAILTGTAVLFYSLP